MTARTLLAAASASLTLHSLLAFPPGPVFHGGGQTEPIEISYVAAPPKPLPQPARPPAKKPAPVFQARPLTPLPAPVKPQAAKAKAAGEGPAEAPRVRGSAELLADPKVGKVFMGYFAAVRAKIQRTVRERYSQENPGEGSVSLFFVLNAYGRLDSVSVIEKQSEAAPAVLDFAVDCVKSSAPFTPFPTELKLRKISFNVTLLFEEV